MNDRVFRPCRTCKYDQRSPENTAICAMFGWVSTAEARQSVVLCGRYGDAWEARVEPDQPAKDAAEAS